MRRLFGKKRPDLGASKKTDDLPEVSPSNSDYDAEKGNVFKNTGSRVDTSVVSEVAKPPSRTSSTTELRGPTTETVTAASGYEAAIAAATATALRGSAPKPSTTAPIDSLQEPPAPTHTFKAVSQGQGMMGASKLKHSIRLTYRALMLSKLGRAVVRLTLLAILLLAGGLVYQVHQQGGMIYLQSTISSRLHRGEGISAADQVVDSPPLPDVSDVAVESPTDHSSDDLETEEDGKEEVEDSPTDSAQSEDSDSDGKDEETEQDAETAFKKEPTEDDIDDEEARSRIEERFQEAQMWRELDEKMGNLEQDNQEVLLDQGEEEMFEDSPDWRSGNEKAMSDEYRDANIRVIDGIEFERVGEEWFPVTTKDPKERSMEEKKIVAFEKTEKAEMRKSRRGQMLDKLIKAGLTESQAEAVVQSKMKGNLKADLDGLKDGGDGGGKIGKKIDRHGGGNFGSARQNRRDAIAAAADGEQYGGGIGESADERAVRLAVEANDGDILEERSQEEGTRQKSWFERASVRERLGSRFLDCTPFQGPFPNVDGLSVVPKIKCEQFLWKPNPNPVNGTEEFDAGPVALEAAVMANAAAQLEVQRAPVAPHMWGRCALVGNSGMLRMTTFGRSVDSHDTVLRINQAPLTGYSRRVGTRVTHRVFNRLWTRAYYSNQSAKKNKAIEQYPLEGNLTLLITRANLKEYGLLAAQLAETRPDVLAARVSSRACSMAQPLLEGFRERMCQQGYGPFKGLNVPSSGWVAAHMLLQLCTSVTVYGFGVEGMQKASRGLPTGMEGHPSPASMRNITYHYFQGLGARKEGNDVHSFDTEEKTFEALSNAGFLTFCKYREGDDEHNWRCGCQDPTGEACRPIPLPVGEDPNLDCMPGYDCALDLAKQRLAKLEEAAELERANGGPGVIKIGGGGRGRSKSSKEEEILREMQKIQELEAQKKFEAEWQKKLEHEEAERKRDEDRMNKETEERQARLREQQQLMEQQQMLLRGEPEITPTKEPDPPSDPPPLPPPQEPPVEDTNVEDTTEESVIEDPSVESESESESSSNEDESSTGASEEGAEVKEVASGGENNNADEDTNKDDTPKQAQTEQTDEEKQKEIEREKRRQRREEREQRKKQQSEQAEQKSKEDLLALEMAAQEAAAKLSKQEQQAAEALSVQQQNLQKARAELQEQAMTRETSLLRAQQALELEAQKREAELQLAAKQKETELQRVLQEQQSLMNMKMQEESQANKKQLEEERSLFYQEQEKQWKAREAKLVAELNNLGTQYQSELDQRLKQEISLREQMYQAQMQQKEQELQLAAQKQRETLLQQEAGVLKEREDMWRKQEQELLKQERKKAKDEQERVMSEERARVEAEFARKATEIAAEHDNLNNQLQNAEQALLMRQKTLESELLQRSAELEDIRKMVDDERQQLMREKADVEQYRMAARKEVENYMTAEQRAEMEARGALQREQQLKAWRENELKERQELEDLLKNERQKSKLVAQAAEKAQKVAEAAIKMGQVEKESARLEAQKEQEKARRAQKEAALMALEAQREAESEKQKVLVQAHAELEAARSARAEAEKVAQIARSSADEEKKQILAEAKQIAAQDHKQLEQARLEWEGSMSKASEESEEKLRAVMQEKANEVRKMREEMAQRMAEERKSILTAKQSELDRVALEAEHERERAVKAEKVAEAAIRVGDEEKRAAEVARREAEEEARRAVQRAQKAKGVAEAAIRLGEMEKQAALSAKKEAESALADSQMTYQQKLDQLEVKHKEEIEAREHEQEIKDQEEETIPVLEAKLSMLRQFEEEEKQRRVEEEEQARQQAEIQAQKFMEREKLAAEKKAQREKEDKEKRKQKEKQDKWNKLNAQEKKRKDKAKADTEEKLFARARAMDRDHRHRHL
mmetsp:Transcript_4134/g.4738  ORF Transcript_4134/g.4738 Transcript_4134/m.4738 type:complete len:1886 (-) Transcript_4134:371-6028(-)|eukprot:CAMPEP_0197843824 /NCGR_PEP_ID=MMETSP1438-20131217/769_1 /TAXON_ID=1461541 /ORGANISM="Pterosperma sp., Strain CCMP1384" /LENGTH=1885 /DNA_ID=CAMNT_0043454227 /DNA_START=394 /DNA_END=6051 /DNA_ORIENTATION=-